MHLEKHVKGLPTQVFYPNEYREFKIGMLDDFVKVNIPGKVRF